MAKSLICLSPLTCYLALHQNLHTDQFKTKCILFPMTKNYILWTKIKNSRRGTSAKLGLCTNQQILQKKIYRHIDRNFSMLSDKVLGDTSLHYTQELSVTLSLLIFSSYLTHIQKISSFFIKLTSLQIFPYIFWLSGQTRHFWWHLSFFNFLLRCLISQLRGISAKFRLYIFASPGHP